MSAPGGGGVILLGLPGLASYIQLGVGTKEQSSSIHASDRAGTDQDRINARDLLIDTGKLLHLLVCLGVIDGGRALVRESTTDQHKWAKQIKVGKHRAYGCLFYQLSILSCRYLRLFISKIRAKSRETNAATWGVPVGKLPRDQSEQ